MRIIQKVICLFILLSVLCLGVFNSPGDSVVEISAALGPQQDLATDPIVNLNSAGTNDGFLQFTSAGHVLGFSEDGVMVASSSHMLRIDFLNSRSVAPEAAGAASQESIPGQSSPLGSVTYRDVWDGVTLIYDASEASIVKSTYYIDTTKEGVQVDHIRLGYNRPVQIDEIGNLIIIYDNGTMVEGAPLAWQETAGRRNPVTVTYVLRGEREVGFSLGDYIPGIPLVIDPELTWNASPGFSVDSGGALLWNTFLGGSGYDVGNAIAVDSSGNVYVSGISAATWGSPLRAYSGGYYDGFVAKLSNSGVLIWNTFLGASGAIAVDGSGNVYVGGTSYATWGSPVRAYSGDGYEGDAFAAKLNGTTGALIWNTFLGGNGIDYGNAIAVDGRGNIYLCGDTTHSTWGSPIRALSTTGYYPWDAFAVKLNNNGDLVWNTFLGSGGFDDNGGAIKDVGESIAVDGNGNVYISGYSYAPWGSPVRAHSGDQYEVFVAKLHSSGDLVWNTFLGSSQSDGYSAIAVDTKGNVYVSGYSEGTWGEPVRDFSGGDIFAAKLNGTTGALIWNTFLGSSIGSAIVVDGNGNVYVGGDSYATWGSPVRAYSGNIDAFAAKLNGTTGALIWNTFLGGSHNDYGNAIALDSSGNVFVAGSSYETWGSPVRAHSGYGDNDAFVAKVNSGGRVANLLLSPASGPPGVKVSVVGTGFGPNSTLNSLSVGGIDVTPKPSVRSNASGNFAASFVVPSLSAGAYPVLASCGGTTASASFTVTAGSTTPTGPLQLKLTPSSGLPGTTVTVAGSGFPSFRSINALAVDGLNIPLLKVVTDAAGNFKANFVMPYLVTGTHNVTASLDGKTASAGFTIDTAGLMVKGVKIYVDSKELGKEMSSQPPVFLDGIPLNVTFIPDIYWAGRAQGTIKYITPQNTYTITTSTQNANYQKTLDVGNEFGAGGNLKVIAIAKNGQESAPYEVPFEVAPFPWGKNLAGLFTFDKATLTYYPGGSAGGFIFDALNERIDGTRIPTTIPWFAGKDIKLEILPNVNIGIDLKGKGTFRLGAEKNKEWGAISYAGKRAPYFEKSQGSRSHLVSKLDGEMSLTLGVIFNYAPSLKTWQYAGSIGIGLEGSYEFPPYYTPFAVGPVIVPLYWKLVAGADGHLELNISSLSLEGDPVHLKPTFASSPWTFSPYCTGSVGVGAADVVSAEGYLKPTLKLEGDAASKPALSNGSVDLIGGVTLQFFIYTKEYKIWDLHWSYNEAKSSTLLPVTENISAAISSNITSGIDTLQPRDYLNQQPYARFYQSGNTLNQQNLLSQKNVSSGPAQEQLLQANVYPYSQPVIISQNDVLYAFWLADDPARDSVNRTELVFSKKSQQGWSQPQPVSDDGTADFNPNAVFLPDGRLLVTWENIKDVLSDNATLDDMLGKSEIAYAVYNPAADTWQTAQLTDDAFLSRSPRLAVGQDGTALLSWIENQSNELFGSTEKPNRLASSFWNGTAWSQAAQLAMVNTPILNSSLAYDEAKGYLVWESDEDGDLSTQQDRQLRLLQFDKTTGWSQPHLLTHDTLCNTNPQVVIDSGQPLLFWNRDNSIVSANITDLNNPQVAVDKAYAPGNDFQVITSSEGIRLIWSGASEGGSDIFVAQWNRASDLWGLPKPITSDSSTERAISAAVLGDGQFVLMYDKVLITLDQDGAPQSIPTDLYLLNYQDGVDLAVEYISVDKPAADVGDQILITAQVGNFGESINSNIPVQFFDADLAAGGQLIQTASATGPLAPGVSGNVSISWNVTQPGPVDLHAVIDPAYAPNDRDRSNDMNSLLYVVNNNIIPDNTPVGSNVTLSLDNNTGVVFQDVVTQGSTNAETLPDPSIPGYKSINGACTNITTTAAFSGNVSVYLNYNPLNLAGPESQLKLFQLNGDSWEDVPAVVDMDNHFITGNVTQLSTFVVVEIQSKSDTITTLISSPNPSLYGQLVTFMATVTGTAGTPAGTIIFVDRTLLLGTCDLNESGQAAFSTSSLFVGSHSITAIYYGGSDFNDSSAPPLTQVVSAAAMLDISVMLQGSSRPDSGWNVPLTVNLFTPGTITPADVLTATPVFTANLTTAKSGSTATVRINGLMPGTYDISVVSPHCLINVKRNVVITSFTAIIMGTLLEGNANNDIKVNIQDFGILAGTYGKHRGQTGFDERADFNRDDTINISDFGLLAASYGKYSPIE